LGEPHLEIEFESHQWVKAPQFFLSISSKVEYRHVSLLKGIEGANFSFYPFFGGGKFYLLTPGGSLSGGEGPLFSIFGGSQKF